MSRRETDVGVEQDGSFGRGMKTSIAVTDINGKDKFKVQTNSR